MTAFGQPRRVKLGLAASEQNWAYTAYELDQLHETFANVAEILPKYRDLSIPDMITSTVKEPLAALERAIQAKDGKQFSAAYGSCQCRATPATGVIFVFRYYEDAVFVIVAALVDDGLCVAHHRFVEIWRRSAIETKLGVPFFLERIENTIFRRSLNQLQP
jgi:hypothetical protein